MAGKSLSDPIYRKEVLRLAADATSAGTLPGAHGTASAHNPACADKVTMAVTVTKKEKGGRITGIAHHTQACILAQASASILGGTAVGQDADGLAALEGKVRMMLEGGGTPDDAWRAFDGVGEIRGRHTCVLLPILALREALEAAEKG